MQASILAASLRAGMTIENLFVGVFISATKARMLQYPFVYKAINTPYAANKQMVTVKRYM
jgi:hypothetical protein